MAERPIFVPAPDEPELVKEMYLRLKWHSGLAPLQKGKNVQELYAAAAASGYSPVLEVSSKLGRHLTAFHLKIHSGVGEMPLVSASQGSKVFERGGPFTDLYAVEARETKRDPRLRNGTDRGL